MCMKRPGVAICLDAGLTFLIRRHYPSGVAEETWAAPKAPR